MGYFRVVPGRHLFVDRDMKEIEELLETMAKLRSPQGCPWDREQDHASLTRHLLEEAAELVDTIDRGDIPHMQEELGDLLLQVVFHAQIASEEGNFTFADVARGINEKLLRRHPHVFGDMDLADSAAVLVEWEKIKASEKASGKDEGKLGPWSDIPPQMNALLLGEKVWKRSEQKKEQVPPGFWKRLQEERERAAKEDMETSREWARQVFFLLEKSREEGWDPEGSLREYIRELIAEE